MPVWHEATRSLVAEGRLVVVGVAEEQHPDRCRLFLQWHGIDWPMAHDPITKLGLTAVPVVTAIDEYGIVRLTHPDPATIEREFVARRYTKPERMPEIGPAAPPDRAALRAAAEQRRTTLTTGAPDAWRDVGDAALLWGGEAGREEAFAAYRRALALRPGDGALEFRLGVCYRARYDSPARRPDDFQEALRHWQAALDRDPNQYIWRRRIQQYGPRLDKPYSFYDWVVRARQEISRRGQTPIALTAEPTGAELATPLHDLAAPAGVEPDPDGRVLRDAGDWVRVETAVAPPRLAPGAPARVHLIFRPNAARRGHWNNEAEPLRVWLTPPPGWQVEQSLVQVPNPPADTSIEPREISVELRAPASAATGPAVLHAYALYNVCEGATGTCLYRRQEITVPLDVSGQTR